MHSAAEPFLRKELRPPSIKETKRLWIYLIKSNARLLQIFARYAEHTPLSPTVMRSQRPANWADLAKRAPKSGHAPLGRLLIVTRQSDDRSSQRAHMEIDELSPISREQHPHTPIRRRLV